LITNKTGYLEINHQDSPGLPEAWGYDQRGFGAGKVYKRDTVSCSHCQRQFVLNPLRQRSRAYCPKCDHYICDACEVVRVASGGLCKTFKQVIDEYLSKVTKGAA